MDVRICAYCVVILERTLNLGLDAAECSGWIHDTSRGTVSFIYLNKHSILLYEIAPTQGESSYNVIF